MSLKMTSDLMVQRVLQERWRSAQRWLTSVFGTAEVEVSQRCALR
jgi:hypothetical protein